MDDSAKIAVIDQNLSQQLQRALTANKDELFQVMQEFSGEALLASLRNAALDEHHLLALLKRRGLPEELFIALYAGKRLCETHSVKFALVCHSETPAHIVAAGLQQYGRGSRNDRPERI